MRNPVVLHVVRPYPDERAYLAAEAWTIDAHGMFLIDDRVLAPETLIVFDIALESGTKVIRAEGRVEHHVPAQGQHPAGLRVRFRRYGEQTKAFIGRALAHAERRSGAPASQRSASSPPPGSLTPSPDSLRAPASAAPGSLRVRSITPAPGSVRVPPGSVTPAPRSVTPPPLPRSPRSVTPAPAERAPGASTPPRRPAVPPGRRSATPPAGTPLPFESRPPSARPSTPPARATAQFQANAPAHSEANAPSSEPPGRATFPGLGEALPLGDAERGAVAAFVNAIAPAAPASVSPGTSAESPRDSEAAPASAPLESRPSGVHGVASDALPLPTNRDELLARLRERARTPRSGNGS